MGSLELPPGYRFIPSDTELLKWYLKPKLVGNKLPCDIITEKEMYGPNGNPWDMFDDSSTSWIIHGGLKTVYVFTPLTRKATSSSSSGRGGGKKEKQNYVKKAGCGTWHGQTPREKIMEGGNVVGFRRLLTFHVNDVEYCLRNKVDFNNVGHWLMHEYVLCGFEDFALCRISVDMSKKPKLCPKDVSRNCTSSRSNANKKTTMKTTTNRAANKVVETPTNHSAATDDRQEVVLNESCNLEILASTSCVPCHLQGIPDKVLPQYGEVASFRVEEKEAVSAQALAYEEAVQLLMNDGEDFENLGTEELPNFSSGFMDASSLDLEHLFNGESWSDMMELIDNIVQPPMQNMSCSKALGKRKPFEAQDSGPSKKLCM